MGAVGGRNRNQPFSSCSGYMTIYIMTESEEFSCKLGEISLKCQLQGEWTRIDLQYQGQKRYATFSQAEMTAQLLQLFGDVPTFYKCFRSICDNHRQDSPTVSIDVRHCICASFSQRVYRASTKRSFTIPTQLIRTMNNENSSEVLDWSELLTRSRTVEDLKQCLLLLAGEGKATKQRVDEGGFEINELKRSVKQLEYEVYKLSVRNNELTQCINQISKLTNQQFRVVQQVLGHLNLNNISNISSENSIRATPKRNTMNTTMQGGLDLQGLLQGRSDDNKQVVSGLTKESEQQMNTLRKHVPELKWIGLQGATRFHISIDTSTPHYKENCELRDQVMAKLNTDAPTQFVGIDPFPPTRTHYFAVKRMRATGIAIGVVDTKHSQAETSSGQAGCWCYFGNKKATVDGEKFVVREWQKGQVMAVVLDMDNGVIKWLIQDVQVHRASLPPPELVRLLPYFELAQRGPRLQLNL